MTDAKKPPEPPEEDGDQEASAPGGGEEGAKKVVDEDWKAEVRREKEKLDEKLAEKLEERARRGPEFKELPPADFMHFVSGIAAQTLMQLGELDKPAAGGKAVDLASARYSIDILGMLEEKTKGNLTSEEERYLKAALHDLRMRFVDASSGKGGSGEGTEPGPGPG